MDKRLSFFKQAALLCVLFCSQFTHGNALLAQTAYSKLVVFGDSLSDTGNLAVVNLPPPYFDNRISDGPVAADLLSQAINSNAERSGHLLGRRGGFNYAVAGGNIFGSDREDLTSQVSAYLARVNGVADSNALYFVFIGGNDLRDLRSVASVSAANAQIARIVGRLESQLNRLSAAGARAFLVPNVANIGRIPETISRNNTQPGLSARAESYTRRYNQALSAMLVRFQAQLGLSVVEFDLFNALERLLDRPGDFGFTNVEQGCFDPDEFRVEPECLLFGFERRPFFDQLHPSSATNRLITASLVRDLPSLNGDQRSAEFMPAVIMLLLDD